jgi:hypothetical protein
MTVVPQTYTATATWTASGLADTFKQAFIDAGLMTDWFDSFLSGTIENRILRVINDGAKTYGTVYYWFMFTTTGVFVSTTSTWSAATDAPTGTQYIDYLATTTNVTTNHATLLTLVSTTNCTITRYTSGINSAVSFFLIRNGSSNTLFMLSNPSFNASAFVDQNKVQFNNLLAVAGSTSNNIATIGTTQLFHTRASYLGAMGLRGVTSAGQYRDPRLIQQYTAFGNVSGGSTNYVSTVSTVWLPVAENNTNTALASDHTPVFTAPTISPYMAALPSDFGIAAYYASSTMAVQDTLVVSSGTEEWEMMAVAVNATVDAGRLLFCARTV